MRWFKLLNVSTTLGDEITKTDGMLNDLDALLSHVEQQDRELADLKEQIVKMMACMSGKLD